MKHTGKHLVLRSETLRVLESHQLRTVGGGDPPAQTEFCSEIEACSLSHCATMCPIMWCMTTR